MPPPYSLDAVITLLDKHHQRATHGAVGALIGVQARSVMNGLPRSPRHSWVVNGQTMLPSDYEEAQMHAFLLERRQVLKSLDDLMAWLETVS